MHTLVKQVSCINCWKILCSSHRNAIKNMLVSQHY